MKHLQKAKIKILPWVMLLATSFVFGCASQNNSNKSCAQRLDEKDFSGVSEDVSCSTYERGSAYLGRAGFLFSNFLKTGASNNFRTALGIPANAHWDTWAGKGYYASARYWTGDASTDYYAGQSRTNANIEIHYFSTLAAMLAEVYVQLDTNGNGVISVAESQSFTNINPTTASDYGSNDITGTNYLQVVQGGIGYILDLKKGLCWIESNADGLAAVNGKSSIPLTSCTSIQGVCSVITKVNNVQKMFKTTIGTSNNVLTLTDSLVANIKSLDADMTSLGLPSNSDLKKALNDFTTKIDNGGGCTSNKSFKEVNQLLTLINAGNETNLGTASYANTNTLSLTALTGASDKALPPPSTGSICTNGLNLNARMVFKKADGTYTADYTDAVLGIQSTFASLKNIQLSADGTKKPIKKGDGIISFEELVCMK